MPPPSTYPTQSEFIPSPYDRPDNSSQPRTSKRRRDHATGGSTGSHPDNVAGTRNNDIFPPSFLTDPYSNAERYPPEAIPSSHRHRRSSRYAYPPNHSTNIDPTAPKLTKIQQAEAGFAGGFRPDMTSHSQASGFARTADVGGFDPRIGVDNDIEGGIVGTTAAGSGNGHEQNSSTPPPGVGHDSHSGDGHRTPPKSGHGGKQMNPNYSPDYKRSRRVSFGQRILGQAETTAGFLTHNREMIQRGKARKSGRSLSDGVYT
ncbi:hypothetical protein C8Q75DRAFT_177952 [Abortiporus biennis]|nr:hypothetical protein C8Q75DRAFT_177952 [Abortiporus biennis]